MYPRDISSRKELLQGDLAAYFVMQSAHTQHCMLHRVQPVITIDWISEQGNEDRVVFMEILHTPWGNLHVDYTLYGIRNAFFTTEPLTFNPPNGDFLPSYSVIWGGHHEWLKCDEFWQGRLPLMVKLHVRGTPFQRHVWNTLVQIPYGGVLFYGDLAAIMQLPRSTRAVASAVAQNPVAWFVPCHRIVPRSGGVGQYRWSADRKETILHYEKAVVEHTFEMRGVQTLRWKVGKWVGL